MKEILAGKTAIVIAHRLSTIRNADRIIVMKDGEIVEEGTHTSLIRAGGHYGELFENQIAIGEA
jgi:ABC-type multidrug transport system fused ATPase/permease subunit